MLNLTEEQQRQLFESEAEVIVLQGSQSHTDTVSGALWRFWAKANGAWGAVESWLS